MKVDVFPTQIYRYRVEEPEVIKERVIQYYEANKWKSKGAPEGWNCDLFTTFGTMEFPMGEMLDGIGPLLDEFMEESSAPGSCIISEMWLNCYESKHWQEKHTHLPGQWSAVYYAILDPNEHHGTNFHDPNEDLKAFSGCLENTITPWVQEGDLIIFPSWMTHSAPLNKSSKLRATISFNFFVDDEVFANEGGNADPEESAPE